MKQHILNYATYNLWANERMVQVFEPLAAEMVEQEIISSFPSVRLTLLHLWSVEAIWLERLKGNSPTSFLANTFTGTNADVYEGLLAKSAEVLQFITTQPDTFFEEPITFSLITASGAFSQTPVDMLQHLFNHQTSHRGQLLTMGRQLGITTFPRTDYMIWLRERE